MEEGSETKKQTKYDCSHWTPNEVPQFERKEESKSKNSEIPFSDKDVDTTIDLALRVKRKIEAMRNPKGSKLPQGGQFVEFLKRSEEIKAREKDQMMSASAWDLDGAVSLQVYFNPIKDSSLVVPKLFVPTDEHASMKRPEILELLREDIDEKFIRKLDVNSISNDNVIRLLYHINKLINVPLAEHEAVTLGSEDKEEIYTDIVVRDLLYLLGIDNPTRSKLGLKEEYVLETTLGYKYKYISKIEFLIVPQQATGNSPIYVFVEDKRLKLKTKRSYADYFAQRVAEALSVALNNFADSDNEKPQEVFAIGVRHRYFTFWHTLLSQNYLEKLVKDPTSLAASDFGVFKQYPVTQFGLDICEPKQRKEIIKLLLGLIHYIDSGIAKIGDY